MTYWSNKPKLIEKHTGQILNKSMPGQQKRPKFQMNQICLFERKLTQMFLKTSKLKYRGFTAKSTPFH